jgi:hypothetical protein
MDYGIKVMKTGYGVTDNDIRNIILSSKYNMLKYHSDNLTSLEITNGNSSGTVSVTHDLGFVPAFISYVKSTQLSSKDYILPYPGGVYSGTGYAIKIDSYATSSNITMRVINSTEFGTYNETANDLYCLGSSACQVGKSYGNDVTGYMRFVNVDLTKNQSIDSADINFYVEYKGAGSGNLKTRTWGIDEDNTSSFGDPTGRATTDAYFDGENGLPSPGGFFSIYGVSMVREIIARNGWDSGNAIGFRLSNNGSNDNVWATDTSRMSYLRIVKSGVTSFYFRVIIFKDRIDF